MGADACIGYMGNGPVASLPKSRQPCSQAPQYPTAAVSGVGEGKEGCREESGVHTDPRSKSTLPAPCTRVSLNLGGEAQSSLRDSRSFLLCLKRIRPQLKPSGSSELGPNRNILCVAAQCGHPQGTHCVLGKGHIA